MVVASEFPAKCGVTFRHIAGFSGYCIGDDGSVWSSRQGSWRQMKPTPVDFGYLVITLRDCGRKLQFYVHRLVLEAFVGLRPDGMVARHFPNKDPSCNTLTNLNWGTYQENSDDMEIHGTVIRGDKIPWSVLTPEAVLQARNEYVATRSTVTQIAQKYNVAHGTMTKALRHITWKHVGGPRPLQRISFDKTSRGLKRQKKRLQKLGDLCINS